MWGLGERIGIANCPKVPLFFFYLTQNGTGEQPGMWGIQGMRPREVSASDPWFYYVFPELARKVQGTVLQTAKSA